MSVRFDRTKLRIRAYGQRIRAIRTRRPHKSSARVRMRNFGVQKKRYLLAIPLLIVFIAIACWLRGVPLVHARYRPAQIHSVNPLMGWAIDARQDPSSVQVDHSLVYATLTWRALESEQGVYDFGSFEEAIHLSEWTRRGKRLVLRFVMDGPGENAHRDIPEWLYEQLGVEAGTYYENAYGQGFSPNYSNLYLMERHAEALNALGQRYNGNPCMAYVEIGSIGHDGAWTVEDVDGDMGMPVPSDVKSYIWGYINAFPDTPLLAPRPYQGARLTGLGLYNNNLGDEEQTWTWLDEIEYGGYDVQMGTEMREMNAFHLHAVSGARLDDGVNQALLFTHGVDRLLRQLSTSHTTYVSGLKINGPTEAMRDGMAVALQGMGYRLWIREATWPSVTRAHYRLNVDLEIRNQGAQAMGQAWPVALALIRDGKVAFTQTSDVDTRTLTPGKHNCRLAMDLPVDCSGRYQLAVAILDPANGRPAVELGMRCANQDLYYLLGDVTIR